MDKTDWIILSVILLITAAFCVGIFAGHIRFVDSLESDFTRSERAFLEDYEHLKKFELLLQAKYHKRYQKTQLELELVREEAKELRKIVDSLQNQ